MVLSTCSDNRLGLLSKQGGPLAQRCEVGKGRKGELTTVLRVEKDTGSHDWDGGLGTDLSLARSPFFGGGGCQVSLGGRWVAW